ncbi:NUDIX domain-containing protein [Streptomyces sp. NBC_00338]|uniref:NUDIX domain-containing protein n=1 Tax=unclassified Streptomyces TaxID=2593676 RepID=UPI002255EFA2|nr:NUDIX domain-containing protein [Streptomyces sp. NBC_00338]MCX5142864.1 NUDIX domain-containing protein [Streptomyces sp. NBC_00338]WSU61302.1 NUDIX domain-containing protein [Streptomyces sp. NBC_01104]
MAQQTDDRTPALKPALDSMTLLVAAVIVHDKTTNRVVLLQRGENAKFARGRWDLPVGKSEPGEPITETAVRELYEETGLTVDPGSLTFAHIIHGAWGVESPNGFLTVVFATHEWTGEPENREPHKHSQVRWINVDSIPGDFVDATSNALHRYLGGGPDVSLHGW